MISGLKNTIEEGKKALAVVLEEMVLSVYARFVSSKLDDCDLLGF